MGPTELKHGRHSALCRIVGHIQGGGEGGGEGGGGGVHMVTLGMGLCELGW